MPRLKLQFLFGLLSLISFLTATNGFDVLTRMSVANESFSAAVEESLHYATVQPIGTLMLAAPFFGAGLLAAELTKSANLIKGVLCFILIVIVLGWLYFYGYLSAQHALLEQKWTAAALSVGMLAAIAVGGLMWRHKHAET